MLTTRDSGILVAALATCVTGTALSTELPTHLRVPAFGAELLLEGDCTVLGQEGNGSERTLIRGARIVCEQGLEAVTLWFAEARECDGDAVDPRFSVTEVQKANGLEFREQRSNNELSDSVGRVHWYRVVLDGSSCLTGFSSNREWLARVFAPLWPNRQPISSRRDRPEISR